MFSYLRKLWSVWTAEHSKNKTEKYAKYTFLVFFILALTSFNRYSEYLSISGDLPPNVPIVVIKGNFVSQQSKGMTHIGIYGETVFPKPYIDQRYSSYIPQTFEKFEIDSFARPLIRDFLNTPDKTEVMFYGFKLNNGDGRFYPIRITDLQNKTYAFAMPVDLISELLYEREERLQHLYYLLSFLALTFILLIFLGVSTVQYRKT